MLIMKNFFFCKIIAGIVVMCFTCVSCNIQNIIYYEELKNENSYNEKNIISTKIKAFKEKGLLDFLDETSSSRMCSLTETMNRDELIYFVENTDECIQEIQLSENGTESLNVLNAIYSESSIGEVYDAMYDLSPELAFEYEKSLVEIHNMNTSSSRAITGIESIRDIHISFDYTNNPIAKAVDLSESYNWGTVSGYIAASAGAIAGLLMWRFGVLWVKVAGLIAGGVGVTAMSIIFIVWQNSPDWKIFQTLCVAIIDTATNVSKLFTTFSDKEKANKFLEELTKKLKEYVKTTPEAASQINSLLSFIDSNYLKFRNLEEASTACFNHYNGDTEFVAKSISVVASTSAVAAVAYLTGFAAMVQGWIASLTNLIPEWLILSESGFAISLVF